MRLEENLIFELLLLFEEQDDGQGVCFSDHEYVNSNNFSDGQKDQFLSNRNLDDKTNFHLRIMIERGFVFSRESCQEWSRFCLSDNGHTAIAQHRNNVWYKRAGRMVSRWLDKAMTSIFMPIVVSVITVLVLRYFDLG